MCLGHSDGVCVCVFSVWFSGCSDGDGVCVCVLIAAAIGQALRREYLPFCSWEM